MSFGNLAGAGEAGLYLLLYALVKGNTLPRLLGLLFPVSSAFRYGDPGLLVEEGSLTAFNG